jgi:hypothetical protein
MLIVIALFMLHERVERSVLLTSRDMAVYEVCVLSVRCHEASTSQCAGIVD